MGDDMEQLVYTAYSGNARQNSDLYEKQDNLWYKLSDGSYVAVTVTSRNDSIQYTPITDGRNNEDYDWWSGSTYTNLWDNKDDLYAKINGEYQKVTVSRSGYGNNRTYTYTLPDGTQIASSRGDDAAPAISSTDDGYLYLASIDTTQTVYTYTYTDANGTVQTIGTSTGDSTNFTAATLYSRSTTDSGITRLEALKNAAATFANSVEEKAKGADGTLGTEDDISHRIAVVGFASKSGYGDNTELLSIAGSNSGSVGVAYHNITDQNLKDVLQKVDTSAGQTMVSNAIDALAASGATRTDLGLDMAQRILSANPVQPNEKRSRVVIVFTDGAPTSFNGFEKDVADNAITYAGTIKATGATVYTIGIFAGANAVSAGTEPSGDLDQNSKLHEQRLQLVHAAGVLQQRHAPHPQLLLVCGGRRFPQQHLPADFRQHRDRRLLLHPDGGIRSPGYHLPPVHPSGRKPPPLISRWRPTPAPVRTATPTHGAKTTPPWAPLPR